MMRPTESVAMCPASASKANEPDQSAPMTSATKMVLVSTMTATSRAPVAEPW